MEIGTNTNIGYYAQHQAELLNDNLTVFEVIDFAAKGEMRLQIRKILGAFLFSGDSVDKKVKVLSGGEKSRLALALLLLNPYNLLILDEPTNHLDMKARDVLKDALINYQGSLILVSHDRHFLHELTTRTYYFKDKKIKEYLGDIYEFLDKYKMETLRELEYNKANTVRTNDSPSRTKLDREQKKAFERDERKLKRAIEESELEIEKIESAITALEDEFASSALHENIELLKSKQAEYNSLKAALEAKMEEWSRLHEELEKLVEIFSINNSL
jgi:ATP-binding cassette subfamily F protein 3